GLVESIGGGREVRDLLTTGQVVGGHQRYGFGRQKLNAINAAFSQKPAAEAQITRRCAHQPAAARLQLWRDQEIRRLGIVEQVQPAVLEHVAGGETVVAVGSNLKIGI